MADNTFEKLSGLVARLQCKPGWTFGLLSEHGALRLTITVPGRDAYDPERPLTVQHFFPVPITTYNEKSWCRWVFEMCRRLENHELGEWFRVKRRNREQGTERYARPFAPLHGPGEDPYTVHEYRSESEARTLQDGSVTEMDITGGRA